MFPPLSQDIHPMDLTTWVILEKGFFLEHVPPQFGLNEASHSITNWTKLNDEVVRRSCTIVKACLRLMLKA